MARLALLDLRQVLIDPSPDFGRWIAGSSFLEISSRDIKGAHAEIQRPELELNPRQVRVEQKHPLERGNRRFIVS